MNRSHSNERFPDGKLPRAKVRSCTSTQKKTIKRQAKKRTRRDSLKPKGSLGAFIDDYADSED